MEKQFVPYTLALKLKELGFDEECYASYFGYSIDEKNPTLLTKNIMTSKGWDVLCEAPLWQQAFQWMRDNHQLLHTIETHIKDSWLMSVYSISSMTENGVYNGKRYNLEDDENFVEPESYEQAQEKCLTKLIEIVQDANNKNQSQSK